MHVWNVLHAARCKCRTRRGKKSTSAHHRITLSGFAALKRGCHLYSAGRPSRWVLADILVLIFYLHSFEPESFVHYESYFFVFSELTFTFAICYRPSVCRLSFVCNAPAPYSGGWNFRGNISTAFGTVAILWHPQIFYGDRPRGTAPLAELNTRGVAKYSDFGLIEGYISQMVQDKRQVSIND